VDFDATLATLLRQIPRGRYATCGAIARALGDVAASRAVAERVLAVSALPRRDGVATADGRRLVDRRRVTGETFAGFRGAAFLSRLRRRQLRDRERLVLSGHLPVQNVGGIDVAYEGDTAFAAAVITDPQGNHVVDVALAKTRVSFPYIPGYLAFRELPVLRLAWRRLRVRPDVLLVDGHGIAHPAGFGVACAASFALEVPTIGVAKSRLVGTAGEETERKKLRPLTVDGEHRGWILTSAPHARPIFVSPEPRLSVNQCADIIPPLCKRRIPEPLRIADTLSKTMKRGK